MPRVFTSAVALLVCILAPPTTAQAQTRIVTGHVLSAATREAVPYATISLVGGLQTTQSNEQGAFRLTAPTGDVRLAVRAIGRITGRVDVDDILDVIFREFCIGK